MNEVTHLTIERSRWLRGEGVSESRLLRESDNKMCCLGFYMKALGFSDEQMVDGFLPSCVTSFDIPDWLFADEQALSAVNDSAFYRQEERERTLKVEFAKRGITLEFVD